MKLKSILCLLAAAFCVSAFAQPSLALIVNAETPGRTGDHDVDVSAYTADQYITVDLVLRDLGTGEFRLAGWEGSINISSSSCRSGNVIRSIRITCVGNYITCN